MKTSLLTLIFTFNFLFVFGQETSALQEVKEFGTNPGNLKMFVHIGEEITGNEKLPLVVVLHGCGQNAKSIAELTGWNKIADANNFLVLYPQQYFFNNLNLCFNWFNLNDIEKGKGESESIVQMITYLQQNYAIDHERIFITGVSAGGAMSVVMLATNPHLFNAGATFAGTAYMVATNLSEGLKLLLNNTSVTTDLLAENVLEQNKNHQGKYPPLIVYQGLNDNVVHPNNAQLIIKQWIGINNADSLPKKVEKQFMEIEDIDRMEFVDSSGNTILTYYEIRNFGHQLLIKPGDSQEEGGKLGLFGIDKGFHSTFQTAKDFGLIKQP